MKEGYITWNGDAQRPDIRYLDGSWYGGLHCANTLEAFINGGWLPTRIEFSHRADKWYLVDIENGYEILWLTVRH
jgi:hypothetical protein